MAGFALVVKRMTLPLFTAWVITALLNVGFGYDTTSFGGVQSIPAFTHEFGSPGPKGTFALSPGKASFITSIAFVGKFFGALLGSTFIEPFGHRYSIWIVCLISVVGVVIECTSNTEAQFIVGRIVVYYSVGFAEICATTYQSEIVPAGMRATVVGSIQSFNQIGQVLAASVNRRFSTSTHRSGWIVPISVQVIPFMITALGTFFIPDGPRWLISKDRLDDAVHSLERVRPKQDKDSGLCRVEAEAIREALENGIEKGPWLDLFRGTNLRRTLVPCVLSVLTQFTGDAFVSNYSPRFYISIGLGARAFDYNIGSATLGVVGVAVGTFLADILGRRKILIAGCTGQLIFLFTIAGIGLAKNPNTIQKNTLVASVMLFNFCFAFSVAPLSYVIGAEIGTAALREKTMAFNTAIGIISAFVVTFSVPYILAAIGVNMGWLFGGMAIVAIAFTYFCVPELKGRSLEALDELFEARVSARKFASTETHGTGARLTNLENFGTLIGEDMNLPAK